MMGLDQIKYMESEQYKIQYEVFNSYWLKENHIIN